MIKRTTTTGSPRTTALAESLSERSVVTSSHSHEDDSRKMIGNLAGTANMMADSLTKVTDRTKFYKCRDYMMNA